MKKIFALLILAVLFSLPAFAQHSVTLSWTQSTSAGVTSNNVYRSVVSGGPYSLVFSSSSPIVSWLDTQVSGGSTYYYVVTAVCSNCNPSESAYSNEYKAIVPQDAKPNPPSNLTGVQK